MRSAVFPIIFLNHIISKKVKKIIGEFCPPHFSYGIIKL